MIRNRHNENLFEKAAAKPLIGIQKDKKNVFFIKMKYKKEKHITFYLFRFK